MKDQFLINILKDSGVLTAKSGKETRDAWLIVEELIKKNGKVLYGTYNNKATIYDAIDEYLIEVASNASDAEEHDTVSTAETIDATDEQIISDTTKVMKDMLDPIVDELKIDEEASEAGTEKLKEEVKASTTSNNGGGDSDDTNYLGWLALGLAVVGAGYVAYNYFGESDVTLVDLGQQEGLDSMGL